MRLGTIRTKLADVPLIRALPDHMQERTAMILLWISEVGRAEPGEQLFEEGQHDDNSGCLLLDGAVRVTKKGIDPIEVSAPSLLGEMQQLSPEHSRTASVEVTRKAVVLHFLWHDFVALCMEFFTPAEQAAMKEIILRGASNRFEELFDQIVEKTLAEKTSASDIGE